MSESFYGGKKGNGVHLQPNIINGEGLWKKVGTEDSPEDEDSIWGAIKRKEIGYGDYILISADEDGNKGDIYKIDMSAISLVGNICGPKGNDGKDATASEREINDLKSEIAHLHAYSPGITFSAPYLSTYNATRSYESIGVVQSGVALGVYSPSSGLNRKLFDPDSNYSTDIEILGEDEEEPLVPNTTRSRITGQYSVLSVPSAYYDLRDCYAADRTDKLDFISVFTGGGGLLPAIYISAAGYAHYFISLVSIKEQYVSHAYGSGQLIRNTSSNVGTTSRFLVVFPDIKSNPGTKESGWTWSLRLWPFDNANYAYPARAFAIELPNRTYIPREGEGGLWSNDFTPQTKEDLRNFCTLWQLKAAIPKNGSFSDHKTWLTCGGTRTSIKTFNVYTSKSDGSGPTTREVQYYTKGTGEYETSPSCAGSTASPLNAIEKTMEVSYPIGHASDVLYEAIRTFFRIGGSKCEDTLSPLFEKGTGKMLINGKPLIKHDTGYHGTRYADRTDFTTADSGYAEYISLYSPIQDDYFVFLATQSLQPYDLPCTQTKNFHVQ